jgi:hypothetical protein
MAYELCINMRHTAMDWRYPEHRDVKLRHPWLLDSGNPCRNDENLHNSFKKFLRQTVVLKIMRFNLKTNT